MVIDEKNNQILRRYNGLKEAAALLGGARRGQENAAEEPVKAILKAVRTEGDAALFEYTQKFDGLRLTPGSIEVTEAEITAAITECEPETLAALKRAKENILAFHKRYVRKSGLRGNGGRVTGIAVRPVERAGIYVPGGKAAYPSSVLMCALPALAAGVKEIYMATPAGAGLNPLTLAAARECGVKRIFKIGGAQAIAAFAYGTESVPKVNVIAGPGNIYVATAKRLVFGEVGIDSVAGPSEILIIADKTARSDFIAADMLSQAEHDEQAAAVLVTTEESLISGVEKELAKQLSKLSRKSIAGASLLKNGAAVLVKNLTDAVGLSNEYAPEHLELCVKNPSALLSKVTNAGAVFMGNFSPEPLGDYFAGPNHVLPTAGTAKFFSALSADVFMKKISVIKYEKAALESEKDDIIRLAETEGLGAHASAVRIRF